MLPFPPSDPAAITAEIDVVGIHMRRFREFRPIWSPIMAQSLASQALSRVSMQLIPVTLLTAAVQTLNAPDVSSSSQDIALATAIFFMRAAFLVTRSPVTFPE